MVYGPHDFKRILEAAGAAADLVRVPDELLPGDLDITGDIAQHWMASGEKAGETLGWIHDDPKERVCDSVRWHVAHPPQHEDHDSTADERALDAARSG